MHNNLLIKRAFLIGLIFCTSIILECKAQTGTVNNSMLVDKKFDNGKMEYVFPAPTKILLDSFFKANENKCYFIELQTVQDTATIFISSIVCGDKSESELNKVLKVTNRFYLFNKKEIPILLAEDWAFGGLTFANSEGDLFINFTNYRNSSNGIIISAYKGMQKIK